MRLCSQMCTMLTLTFVLIRLDLMFSMPETCSVRSLEGYIWGSGMVMLVHVRDGGYLTLYSDNSSSLRRRKGRREEGRKKSQKEKRKVTGGQGRQRVKGKQEKWPEHLFGARL